VTDSAAGTAFLGPGLASATLGGELTSGGSISAGTTSGSIHSRLNGYLNPLNFIPAPTLSAADGGDGTVTVFGNLGRNIYRGPFQQNWDFSLIKTFAITGAARAFISRRTSSTFGTMRISRIRRSMNVETIGVPNSPFGKIFSTVGTPALDPILAAVFPSNCNLSIAACSKGAMQPAPFFLLFYFVQKKEFSQCPTPHAFRYWNAESVATRRTKNL